MPKKGDRVAPPPPPNGWTLRFATKEAAEGWENLCRVASNVTFRAYEALTYSPTTPTNPERQKRLRGELGTRMVHGRTLEQWQYEVTAGGRIWYCPDIQSNTVWLVYASPQHPHETQ